MVLHASQSDSSRKLVVIFFSISGITKSCDAGRLTQKIFDVLEIDRWILLLSIKRLLSMAFPINSSAY